MQINDGLLFYLLIFLEILRKKGGERERNSDLSGNQTHDLCVSGQRCNQMMYPPGPNLLF